MQKIALIAASLAVLAGPVMAQDAKTTGKAPAEAKFSTVSKDEMFSSKLKGLNVCCCDALERRADIGGTTSHGSP